MTKTIHTTEISNFLHADDEGAEPCNHCEGEGTNAVGNLCSFCEGFGYVAVEDDADEFNAFVAAFEAVHVEDAEYLAAADAEHLSSLGVAL